MKSSMNKIIITSEFIISQDNRKKSIFNISPINQDEPISQYLLFSLTKTKILKNYTILDNGNILMIKASSIKTLEEFKKEEKNKNKTDRLTYINLCKISYYLTKQLTYLINNESKCFYTYDLNNIIVIDNIFVYLCNSHLKDINNNTICIYSPISKKNPYLSPELFKTSKLPIMINYKTIFYSLGLVIIESFLSDNETTKISEILDKLKLYQGTKLYYFLERCLKEEPTERYLLYV
jgi:hypothetical protein